MKARFNASFLVLISALLVWALVGCANHSQGQWILESYSSEHGYVFRKDGVRYEAQCSNSIAPGQNAEDRKLEWLRIYGQSRPPEDECSQVLLYLHKTVPLSQKYGNDILTFQDERKVVYEFTIAEAK
jgi:hypothetical protein